jgi:protease I
MKIMSDITNKNVAILVDNYFEEVEFVKPKEALEAAGAQVTVVSTGQKTLQGMHHAERANIFMPDLTINDVAFEDYDMLVLPGGTINADNLRMNEKAREWVQHCIENAIPIAAICHAPWLLASADVVDGMQLTSYHTIQDDMVNAGADWVDEKTVIDGNVLTSRKPDDIPAFNEAMLKMLTRTPTVIS